jgi:hypothetical protein
MERPAKTGPESLHADPEQPISVLELRLLRLAFEHGELMAEGQVLECKIAALPQGAETALRATVRSSSHIGYLLYLASRNASDFRSDD